MSYQTIVLVGRLGRDPEMKYSPTGQAVTNFSVATDRKYTKEDGQKVQETTWLRVSVWGKQAEACNEYLKKGSLVLVEGRLVPDPATGAPRIWKREDGTPGTSFEVSATTVRFLGSKDQAEAEPTDADNIPF